MINSFLKKSLSLLISFSITLGLFSFSAASTSAAQTESAPAAAASYGLPDKIEDGAILHCWCWSFNTFKENIPQIAAAGFKSIQTSPINKVWDGNKNGDMSLKSSNKGNWWYQYQPVDYTIGNYQLGTEDEFKAMCEEAHKYGVKVIVDIVGNHCTSEFSAISSNVKNVAGSSKNTFHPVTQISDWSNRYQVTQGHLTGLWDLNTQNAQVQQMIYDYMTHVLEDGADGFRFDAAKHIELPDDDASYAGNYWTKILDNDAEFQYGEILLGADRAADYAQLMKITAEAYGTNLRAGLEKKKVTATTVKNYRVTGVDAGQLVTWVESHDTYCTDDNPAQQQYSSWMKINNEQIQQGWAFIAAQGDTTPLFFARPQGSQAYDPNESSPTSKKNFNNKWGDNTIGLAGDGNYYSDEVVAVNKFRNAMVGESKNIVDVVKTGKVTMIERGTKGAVLVSVTDTDSSINVATNLADGEYTDQANGGLFTVANGKLTGTVKAGAVVVLYIPEEEEGDSAREKFIIRATSNFFPETAQAYSDFSEYEDENGDVYVTVEYKMAAPGKFLINLDVDELTWDNTVLEFKEAYNTYGSGRNAKITIFPFAVEQSLGTGILKTFGDDNGGRITGNYTSIYPAAYATNDNNESPITVIRATFKVIDKTMPRETVVNLSMKNMSLCDNNIEYPYAQHVPIDGFVINEEAYSLGTYATVIKPQGEDVPIEEPTTDAPAEETTDTPVEETTEPPVEETTEAPTEEPVEETTEPPFENNLSACGVSNYCSVCVGANGRVGEYVTVTFYAPEDIDIVDIQWGMDYDEELLVLTTVSTIAPTQMVINTNAESYNVMGSFTDVINPCSVTKDYMFMSFGFMVKKYGETTVNFNVVDMTIRINGEDYISIENSVKKTICTHKTTQTTNGYPAACTETGLTDKIVCTDCGKVLIEAEVIPANGHTPVIDKAKTPTCTEAGLTEGSHCSVCNEVITAQEVIPALGHKPIIDPYLAPTCQHEGHTPGSYCERCGEVYVQWEMIPKIPHAIVVDEAVEPSCETTGLTEGSHCSACGEVIKAQNVISALGHSYEYVPAVDPTYYQTGLTDGVRCKRCGEWLIEPQTVPKKEIDFTFGDANGDGIINVKDVTAIQRHLANYEILTDKELGAADVNFDGKIDIDDATLLQMYLALFDVVLG